jgi:hypothetical protein
MAGYAHGANPAKAPTMFTVVGRFEEFIYDARAVVHRQASNIWKARGSPRIALWCSAAAGRSSHRRANSLQAWRRWLKPRSLLTAPLSASDRRSKASLMRLGTRVYDGLRGEGSIPVPLPPPAKFEVSYFLGTVGLKSRLFCRCFCSGESSRPAQLLPTGSGERIFLRDLCTIVGGTTSEITASRRVRRDPFRIHLPEPRGSAGP